MAIVGKLSQGFSVSGTKSNSITWRAKLSFSSLFILWFYVFFPTLKTMGTSYIKLGFNQHGLFVLPLFFGLLYSKKNTFLRISPSVGQFALFFILLFSSLWVFSVITGVTLLEQISVLALLPSIFVLAFGYKISRALFFPLSYIFLLLPIGHLLIPNIQEALLSFLVKAFAFIELPVYWEYQSIHTAYSELNINIFSYGLNLSLIFLAIGCVYSYFITVSLLRRLIIAISFILFHIALIFLGIYALICSELIFSRTIMPEHLLGYYSQALIFIGVATSSILGYKLRQKRPYRDSLTVVDWQSNWQYSYFNWLRPTVIAAVIFAIVPWVLANINDTKNINQHDITNNTPVKIQDWHESAVVSQNNWQPSFPNANKIIFNEYKKADSNNKIIFSLL